MSQDNQSQGSGGTDPKAGGDGSPELVSRDSLVKAVDEAKSAKRRLAEANAKLAEYDSQIKEQKEAKLLEEKKLHGTS